MAHRPDMSKFWRLTPVFALVTALALLSAGILMLLYSERSFREQKQDELAGQAQILASSVTAALAFNDPGTAQEYVNAQAANPEVRAAAVYDAAGAPFASFSRPDARPIPETVPIAPGYEEPERLVVVVPVMQGETVLGFAYVRSAIDPISSRLLRYGGIALLVVMASLVVGVLGAAQAALSRANRELESRAAELAAANAELRAQIAQRELAEEALRQSQKMEAMGQLTGGIAHDFNNLLQVITANLGLIAEDVRSNQRAERRLRNALAGAERAARLTRQLLAFARRQPLEPKVVNLGRLMADTSELLRRTLGETVNVECVISGGLWNTFTDVTQLENAILNLALNSRDAMPDGGKLTLEIANAHLDDAYAARFREVEPGQYVMITVTDSGTGVTAEEIEHAFEPFYTTKPEGQGTGLGLSQVYGFVKQTGGHVRIYSELGHGTSVRIYLPRSRHAEEPVSAPMAGTAAGNGECVLVVEDDESVRDAAVDMLNELGYRVLSAQDGERGLEILRGGTAVDLLFTDVVMPGPVTSRELARQAVALQPGIAVLFTSGYSENAIIHHGRVDDGVHLLSKPYGKEELARKIRAVLAARGQPPAPAAAPASSRLRVLLVEDEVLVRMSTADMIEALGHEVLEAADAGAALRLADTVDGIDVLFTDIGLPDMRGTELAAELRRRHAGVRVILATGYAEPDEAESAGAIHLGKPYQAEDIEKAFARIADGR